MTNNPLAAQMVSDADELQSEVTDRELYSIQGLVKQQIRAKEDVEKLEVALAVAKAKHRKIEEVELPELLKKRGITHIRLADGTVIDVTEKPKAYVKAAHKEEFFKWLEDNGHAAIIKGTLTMSYGKGDFDKMDRERNQLIQHGFVPIEKRDVHNMTLQAWVAEMTEEEEDLPKVVDVHMIRKAKIKKGR